MNQKHRGRIVVIVCCDHGLPFAEILGVVRSVERQVVLIVGDAHRILDNGVRGNCATHDRESDEWKRPSGDSCRICAVAPIAGLFQPFHKPVRDIKVARTEAFHRDGKIVLEEPTTDAQFPQYAHAEGLVQVVGVLREVVRGALGSRPEGSQVEVGKMTDAVCLNIAFQVEGLLDFLPPGGVVERLHPARIVGAGGEIKRRLDSQAVFQLGEYRRAFVGGYVIDVVRQDQCCVLAVGGKLTNLGVRAGRVLVNTAEEHLLDVRVQDGHVGPGGLPHQAHQEVPRP